MLSENITKKHNVTLCGFRLLSQGSKNLKHVLKSLYCLMSSYLAHNVTQDGPVTTAAENAFDKMFDSVTLSRILFEELNNRLSFSLSSTSADRDIEQALVHDDADDLVEELLLLLRCCVLMMRLHPNDLILLNKFQDAVSLHGLLPFREAWDKVEKGCLRLPKAITSKSMCSCYTLLSNDLDSKICNGYLHLLKQMLEVLLDEMFADGLLREYISALESLCSQEHQSDSSSIHIETVLDAIAAHFLLSITGEQTLATFSQSLVWMLNKTLHTPDVSLTVALSLVKHPVMSTSMLLHAHLISLVAEVIGISLSDMGLNIRCKEMYLSAFHESIDLYRELLFKFFLSCSNNSSKQQKAALKHFKQPHSKVYDKVNFVLAEWESSWKLQSGNLFTEIDPSMVSKAISYIEMNITLFEKSSRDNMFSFLSSLVKAISTELDEVVLDRIKKLTMQDLCLLSSILKLMSCSMLQLTHCQQECRLKPSSEKKDAFPGWQSLVDTMHCFRQYNLHLPIKVRLFISDALESHFSTSVDANLLFLHFSFLLSFCIATGLDFLVKGCLFLMMVFMKELNDDLSTIEKLQSGINSGPKLQTHAFSPASAMKVISSPIPELQSVCWPRRLEPVEESCAHSFSWLQTEAYKQCTADSLQQRKRSKYFTRIKTLTAQRMSSRRVASDFQRTRAMLRGEKPKTTNGVVFLKNISKDADLIDELAEFIECKEGKDYSAYIKKRAMLRCKRGIKNAERQWKKKKMIFNMIGSSGSQKRK